MKMTHFASHRLLNSRKPVSPFCRTVHALKLLRNWLNVASVDSHQVSDSKLSHQISFAAFMLLGNSSKLNENFLGTLWCYLFISLFRYNKNGQLAIAGFSDPLHDPKEDDLKLWVPDIDCPPPDLDLQIARFLLAQVADQFCDLLQQEHEAIKEHMSDG